MLMSIMEHFENFPILETRRLTLRKCLETDIPEFNRLASNPNVTTWIGWEPHKSVDETAEFVKQLTEGYERGTCMTWAMCDKETDKFMGLVSFVHVKEKNFSGEVGYWIGEEYWNKGYTTEAMKKIIGYAFETLGLHRITAGHCVENLPSGRVMVKLGMKFEGVGHDEAYLHGKFYDIAHYALINE